MTVNNNTDAAETPTSMEERAVMAFLRRQTGDWTSFDQADLECWLADPACANAYREISNFWRAAGSHAALPEVMVLREHALRRARQVGINRGLTRRRAPQRIWAAAAVVVLMLGLMLGSIANIFFDDVSEAAYETGIGEQRMVELADRSRIALDAQTTLGVRLTRDSRVIELVQGQAQFMVASDPRRPFRVEAGRHTITAVGTSFNVEYLDRRMQVAMVEGKAAVSVGAPSGEFIYESQQRSPVAMAKRTMDLIAGQELRVEADGSSQILKEADIAAVIAWRQGKIILKDAPLDEAVRRLNRYSRLQIKISEPSLGALHINGIFDSGDTLAFIEAVQSYLPVIAYQDGPDLVRLLPVQ